ncbi:hypothetical protein DL764_007674 [Monosporascus ibericus]|uniref:Berberine/berberine-like domain-containing protein n=1 Tax=Monosporascus ibericus TaxID=155417 RepID=A0A4Q4T1K7_9PEZI|nr:hypothetical protein DL764_007674 [Monosporascus ibericus]
MGVGPENEGREALAPILALEPSRFKISIIKWNKLVATARGGVEEQTCQDNVIRDLYRMNLKNYSASTYEAAFPKMADFFDKSPEGGFSILQFEFFSNQAMAVVPSGETAWPPEGRKGIYKPNMIWTEADSATAEAAMRLVQELREDHRATSGYSEPAVFVNYARGDETLKQIYGKKNLHRLASLKEKWDPKTFSASTMLCLPSILCLKVGKGKQGVDKDILNKGRRTGARLIVTPIQYASGQLSARLAAMPLFAPLAYAAEAAGITTVQLDVMSDESVAKAVSTVRDLTGGSLDALVNNAGAAYSLPLMDIDIDKARQLFDLNTFSMLRVSRAFFPLLMKSTYGGRIINNTSAASMTAGALPFQGAYNASKAAAANFTEVLRLELAPFGVKVINLMTGGVKSTFFDNAPRATLPPTSMYNIAKEDIERVMAGEDTAAQGTEAHKWAELVVKDLNTSSPPYWIWRGRHASEVRLASLLPVGMLDNVMKNISKLDVVERKIKEKGGVKKIMLKE